MSEMRETLERKLAQSLVEVMRADIRERGNASLLVSGGSTPKGLFRRLSQADLDWSAVQVSLVDERWLEDGHPDQNGHMVKSTLLTDQAKKARFIPLVYNLEDEQDNLNQAKNAVQSLVRPFSAVLLGMGNDGHTASLFPDALELDEGMDLANTDQLLSTHPVEAPYARISFTRSALLHTSHLFLHFYGKEKREIWDEAQQEPSYRPYPIQGFYDQKKVALEVFWEE